MPVRISRETTAPTFGDDDDGDGTAVLPASPPASGGPAQAVAPPAPPAQAAPPPPQAPAPSLQAAAPASTSAPQTTPRPTSSRQGQGRGAPAAPRVLGPITVRDNDANRKSAECLRQLGEREAEATRKRLAAANPTPQTPTQPTRWETIVEWSKLAKKVVGVVVVVLGIIGILALFFSKTKVVMTPIEVNEEEVTKRVTEITKWLEDDRKDEVPRGPMFTELPRLEGFTWHARKTHQFSSDDVAAGRLFKINYPPGGVNLCLRISENGGASWTTFKYGEGHYTIQLLRSDGTPRAVGEMIYNQGFDHFRVLKPILLAYYWMEEDRRPEKRNRVCEPDYDRYG